VVLHYVPSELRVAPAALWPRALLRGVVALDHLLLPSRAPDEPFSPPRQGADVWACEWCGCREHETHHKANGPSGQKTLCSACSARYRSGHNGMPTQVGSAPNGVLRPGSTRGCLHMRMRACGRACTRVRVVSVCPLASAPQNDKGEYVCDACQKTFSSMGALGGHRRFCDGGTWRCGWCHCTSDECQNKSVGPDGPATLCSSCSQRFRAGHTGPPPRNEDGKYVCEDCGRTFDQISGLGSHRARCDGGVWRCEWCKSRYEDTSGKVHTSPTSPSAHALRHCASKSAAAAPPSGRPRPYPARCHTGRVAWPTCPPRRALAGPGPQRRQDALLGLLGSLPRRRDGAAAQERRGQVRVRPVRAHLRDDLRPRLAPQPVRRWRVAVRVVQR
jgi:hypothetical protein